MYAKVYEANAKNCSPSSVILFGGFYVVIIFVSFLYAKYAKFFILFQYGCVLHLSYGFRIFAYFIKLC